MLPRTILTTATTLYASPTQMESHCIRMVIAEKDIQCNQYLVEIKDLPQNILELNPYQILPVLFDRNMVLYDFAVVSEYLDERFPFPPLMPVDPINRAEERLLLFRFVYANDSLFALARRILTPNSKKDATAAKKLLTSHLISLTPIFDAKPYFKSDEMTIIDVCLAVLLWRLEKMNIKLPMSAKPVISYGHRIFAKDSFKASLTNLEKEYRL